MLDHTFLCGSVLPGLRWCPFISVVFGIICLPDFWPARAPQPLQILRALPITCSQPQGVSEPRTLPISPPAGWLSVEDMAPQGEHCPLMPPPPCVPTASGAPSAALQAPSCRPPSAPHGPSEIGG